MTLRRLRYSLCEFSLLVLTCVGAGCHGAVVSSDSHYYDGQETPGYTEKLQVRLTGGLSPIEGRVLVHSEGRWRAVCDREWGIPDADVICRQLGFGCSSMAWRGAHFGEEPSEAVDDFRIILSCRGKEADFSECLHRKISAVSCGKSNTAGVRCSNISSQKDNPIRLVGGITPNLGQVQLYHNRTWNVICDESWDMIKAAVACRELGYPGVTADWGKTSLYGDGDDDPQRAVQLVSCTGAENKVAECKVGALRGSRCANPVSVTCVSAERNGFLRDRLRLTGGTHPNMGRVEVNIDGNVGTICDEDWDLKDARVVCKELGYSYATAAPGGAHFGEGTGAVLFSRMGCTGHERHLLECARSGFKATNCQHGHDAGVVCSLDPTAEPAGNLMRLSDSSSGFVEVFHDGQWWHVCGQGWDPNDASVACRQLGYRHPSKTISPVLTATSPVRSIDARGDIGVLLNKMRCHGNETNLAFCQHGGLGPQVCAPRSGHATVDCNGNMPRRSTEIEGKVRLASGKNNFEGRVEIFLDGAWATVCADRWDMADAKVVCRQLGFTHATSALVSAAHFGPGSGPIVLDEVECVGDEDNLLDCRAERLYQHDCQHRQDAGVRCDNRTVSYDYSVRLTGGSTPNAGRLEILLNSIWHTVCDVANTWNIRGANVVCRELGFPGASQPWAKISGALEKGKRSFATVKCLGNETTIAGCQYGGVGNVDCGGVKHEARVLCEQRPKELPYRIRLDGGSTPREGIVQILQDEHWFPVCGDGWDIADALVVCKQRGYQFAKSATSIQERRGVAEAQLVMTNRAHQFKMVLQQVRGWSGFRCTGHEDHLLECDHTESRTVGCGRGEVITVAHVECSEKPSITAGERLRLSGNSKENEGRVEVYYEGMWWKVCADDWDMPDATVVCRQIGYPSALVPYKLSNDSAKGDICERDLSGVDAEDSNCRLDYLMGDLQCTGEERSVVDCRHAGFGRQYCSQNHDAGVVCDGKRIKPTFKARLGGSDPSHPYEGRVELQHGGRWWLVCNEGWDYTDAQVLCRQLGFPGAEADPALQTFYKGRRTGEMGFLLEDVDCLGTEDNLAECLNGGVGKATCQTQVAVGVRCSTDLLMIEGPDIRLIGGESLQEGRVELYHDNRWWTICDDNWDISAAEVACKQLGFPSAESAVLGAYFGKGREDMGILLDEVNCRGSEDNLLVCSHHTVGEHDCKHTQDAGVRCSKPTVKHSMKLPKSIRLTGGNTSLEGVVELYHNYRWWTVCRTGNLSDDLNSAIIVCRQLEFSTAQSVIPAGNFTLPPRYTRALLSGLRCQGGERNLTLCRRHDGLEVAVGKQCDRTQSLAVRCTPSEPLNSPKETSRRRKRTGPTTPVLAVIIATVFVTGFLIGSLILYHVYQACDRFLSRQRTSSSDNSPPATNVTSNTDSVGRGNQGRGRSRSRGDSESTRNKDMFIELYPLPPAPDPGEDQDSETEVDGDGEEYGDWTGAPIVQRENSIPPPNTPDAAFDGTLV